MKYILIVGLGNMGKAHYEAILKVKTKKSIYLFDKIESKTKSIKFTNNDFNKTIICKNITDIDNKIDLLVLSTTADGRYTTLIDILSKTKVSKILFEKFLFQKLENFKKVNEILNKKKIKSWVHLPFRQVNFFSKIKSEINNKDIFIFRSIGGNWSMASNIIHTLDLFSYITGSKKLEILYQEFNKKNIHSKKRSKFNEAEGHVYIKGKYNHYLEVSKDSKSKRPKELELITKENHYIISNNKILTRNINNWNFKKNTFMFPKLSIIGKEIYRNLLLDDKCNLPTYADSIDSHKFVFRLFKHINKKGVLNIT